MRVPFWVWCLFAVLVPVMLAIDLGLDSRQRKRPITLGAAAIRSVAWIVISLLFGLIVLALFGARPTVTYYTAYLLEKSLSVDNLFVFALISSELTISPVYQHRVLPIFGGGRTRLLATPLLIALIVIETSDLVFALDSIPAVLAVTREPFLVYTSNVFAILGLRSLYFLVVGALERFHALRYALAAILTFVGAKLLLSDLIEIPNWASLAVVIGAVLVAIAVSTPERRGQRA